MRVIILGTRGFPNIQGGVENHCENLAINLVKLGCDVIVFSRKPYVDYKFKEYEGVNLISLPTIRHKSLEAFIHTFIGMFVSIKYKPDILHIQGIGPGLFSFIGRLFRIKVILTSHGSNYRHLKWNSVEKKLLHFCEYIGMKTCNDLIAISSTIAEEIKEKYNRIAHVIPNGVEFLEEIASINTLLKLNLEKRKYILTVGRLVPEKGFHNLVTVFKNMNLPEWKLVIVGGDDHNSTYSKTLINSCKSDPNIIFTGFLTGIPLQELYSHAGVFILPSYYEGQPISILEAISFRLPCIASDIPGNRSIGLPDESYFKLDSLDQMEAKISEFMHKEYVESTIKNQAPCIKSIYDWKSITKSTLSVYINVIKKK